MRNGGRYEKVEVYKKKNMEDCIQMKGQRGKNRGRYEIMIFMEADVKKWRAILKMEIYMIKGALQYMKKGRYENGGQYEVRIDAAQNMDADIKNESRLYRYFILVLLHALTLLYLQCNWQRKCFLKILILNHGCYD
jgi:hypothetical protein